MLVDIDGDYFESDNVSVVRPVRSSKGKVIDGQCVIFMIGGHPVDGGFLIDMDVEDVIEILNNAKFTVLASAMDNLGSKGDTPGDGSPSIEDDAVPDLGT